MDQITLDRIQLMHPILREQLEKDYIEINKALPKGVRLRFSHTYRSPKEQHQLFLKRPKVTNADAWQSIHNYGMAFDIVILLDPDGDGKWTASFKVDKHWKRVVDFFKSKGWEAGIDWKKFPDAPHFQMDFGHTWKSLKKLMDSGQSFKDENGVIYPKLKSE